MTDIYLTAQISVGIPAGENSETVAMLRFVLRQLVTLCQLRDAGASKVFAPTRVCDDGDVTFIWSLGTSG